MSTTAVPSKLPEDFALNIDNLDKFSNSTSPTFIDRLGISKRTLAGVDAEAEARMNANDGTEAAALAVRESLSTTQRNNFQSAADLVLAGAGYAPPVAYTAGLSMTLPVQTVNYLGQTYAPILSVLPFTTSGTFETAKFRLIQGVAAVDLAAAGGAELVGHLPDGLDAVATTAYGKLRGIVSVFDFMSEAEKADVRSFVGSMNVTTAFQRASAHIQLMGGGRLIIPAGKYKVGRQTFAGANGLGYSYRAEKVLDIRNCTTPVVIECQGAILKFASGLKFGSFDPVTGLPNAPALPNTNANYAADVGAGMFFRDNSGGVFVKGALEIDGNNTQLQIGGQWGDVGYQRSAYGVNESNSASFYIENAWLHHNGTDGIVVGYTGAVAGGPKRPKTLIGVNSEYNARQGLSWVGGNGLTAINCKFNRSGRAVNVGMGVALGSSPGAGIDIEAESSVCRDGLFINCEAVNNANTALVADSGDSADVQFIGCTFGGKVWPKKPGFKFQGCKFHGTLVNLYGHADPAKANSFQDCTITDASLDDFVSDSLLGTNLFESALVVPVYFTRCTINATKRRPGRMDYFVLSNSLVNMTFPGTAAVNNKDYVALLNGAVLQNTVFDANITANAPADGFYLGLPGSTVGRNTLVNTAGIVRWTSWSTASGGYVGDLGTTGPKLGVQALSLFPGGWNSQYYGTLDIYAMTAAPTAGAYKKGDRVVNQNPAVGSAKGWICTIAGTPGTWVSEGVL